MKIFLKGCKGLFFFRTYWFPIEKNTKFTKTFF
jgi:hypothetical protein